ADRCRYRLGNMTLLNATKNRKLGTAGFAVKREVFAQSEFGLTKRVSEYEDWTEQTLAQHQKWLAKQATSIWRIAELS
ncbi:MAG: HNH endonuclease, partial [Myxococcales bacterium]|nr:HNH endonuclease [Myxococcales bacterium]